MIQCTKCLTGNLTANIEKNRYSCTLCGFEILIKDSLVIFHPEDIFTQNGIEPCIFEDLIPFEEKHFWIKARRDFIRSIFKQFVNYTDEIIEIGAGTGALARYLKKNGYENISIGEIHLHGLEYVKDSAIKNRYQFDLIKTPFREHFDVVGMFDVLEHIDNDELAVKNVYKMLKPSGRVIVTVPAHQWLWSKQDAIAYHRRRYETEQLRNLFEKNGFKILKADAFFISILPFLLLRKFINKDNNILKESDFRNRFNINPIINLILSKILDFENRLLCNVSLKWGSSIGLVAEKL